jgi:tetratricopeptide (TPR) repeat protein
LSGFLETNAMLALKVPWYPEVWEIFRNSYQSLTTSLAGLTIQEVVIMKKLSVFPILLLSVFAGIMFAGCASKPTDELEMARRAMDEALSKQAPEYAPNDWDRAQMNWQEANALIQMKRYDEARNLLIQAVGNYNKARDESNRRLESLQIEINSMLPILEKEIAGFQRVGENAKTSARMRRRIEAALPIIDEKTAAMNVALERKDYLLARRYGQETLRYINDFKKKNGMDQG